ncbi:MAG: aminotransferase class III-fold pyridoxal phosphate-dependent enzyme [Pseudooceanicola nanhaiensis]
MNALPPDTLGSDPRAAIVSAFAARTAGSKALAEASRAVLADKTPLAMPFSPALKEAYFPVVAERSEGARLWDVDGNEYIDILMGLGCNLLGHNPPEIRAAIEEQLASGIQIGPQSKLAGETAELYARLTGHDRVTFSTTGTEAVMTAVRLARAATGRRRIAVFTNSYHGHADMALFKARRLEYIRRGALARARSGPLRALRPLLEGMMFTGAKPGFPGIPGSLGRDVLVLEYDNPAALRILRRHGTDLAAVLVEPVQSRVPGLQPRKFLHNLRAVTESTGTALIFDEMISGFRVAPGGAQEYFDVRADLATYGKIAGGGLPLSLIAGSKRFMDRVDGGEWHFGDDSVPGVPQTFFAGTHARHPLSLAAALAMAKILLREGPELQRGLNADTSDMVSELNMAASDRGLPVQFTSFGSFFGISREQSRLAPDAISLLSLMLLTRGIHLRPGDAGGFLSTAHGPAERAEIVAGFVDCLERLNENGLLTGHKA